MKTIVATEVITVTFAAGETFSLDEERANQIIEIGLAKIPGEKSGKLTEKVADLKPESKE